MKRVYKKFALITGLVFLAGILSAGLTKLQAAEEKIGGVVVEEAKTIQGELISLSPRNNPKYIGISYEPDNADYYFMLSDDAQVIHKNSLNDLQKGDTIEISFKQKTRKDKLGNDMIDRTATKIKYLKPAKKEDDLISR